MRLGRPRKIQPQSSEARKFLDLYLDPLLSPEKIRQICQLSRSTYYSYERELNLPHLRVAIGCPKPDLPLTRALASFQGNQRSEELDVVRKIAAITKIRVKLVPVPFMDHYASSSAVRNKNVDFAISSIATTRERLQEFHFSDSYFQGRSPYGVLIRRKVQGGSNIILLNDKPSLGTLAGSVHGEFALNHLQHEFRVRTLRTGRMVFEALTQGRIDFALLHPEWLQVFGADFPGLEICSKPYWYRSETGMIFHADSADWITPINLAIAQMHEMESKGESWVPPALPFSRKEP